MSWSCGWDLEARVDGCWTLDERNWLPQDTRIDLNAWCDFDEATAGLSFDVMHMLESVTRRGVPDDASPAFIDRHSDFALHCHEEHLPLPIFAWVMVSDILVLNWDGVVAGNTTKQEEIDRWMEHLRSLGFPEDHRVISQTLRGYR